MLGVVLKFGLDGAPHGVEIPCAQTHAALVGRHCAVVVVCLCALPGASGHALQLIARHVAKHFVIDARDKGASARQLPSASQSPVGDASVELHGRVAEIRVPEHEHGRVEYDGDDRRDGQIHRCGEADCCREEDIHRILAVLERVAEPHRGHDARKAERKGDAVLHEQHDARDDEGEDDEELDDGLLIAAFRAGEQVDPRHGERQEDGRNHRHGDRHGERDLIQRRRRDPSRRHGRSTAEQLIQRRRREHPAARKHPPEQRADGDEDGVIDDKTKHDPRGRRHLHATCHHATSG